MNIEQTIANNIKFYMELRNLKQIDIAKGVNVSPATVSNWLKGIQVPRMDKVDKMCELLCVDRSQLLLPKEEGERVALKASLDNIVNEMDLEQIKTLLDMARVLLNREKSS